MPEPETRQIAHDLAGQDTDRLLEETEQELAEMLGASGEDLGAIQASGFEEAGEGAAGPRVGRMIRGRVRSVGEREVYVDLLGPAAKFVGVVPVEQFDEMPEPGAELEFEIRRIEESEGILRLSRRGAVLKATWETLEPGMDVEARVSGHNKGGLELKIAGVVDGFMPASHVDFGRVDDFEAWVGRSIEASVLEVDRRAKQVLLSRRRRLEQQRDARLAELEKGQELDGVVTRIESYGGFIDVGGFEGLLHISDMSWGRVEHPNKVLELGQRVRVQVLEVDRENHRVSLGLKQTMPDPWETLPDRLRPGQSVQGTVTKVLDFGAFVEVESGVEGLVPVSEISHRRIGSPSEVVAVGDHLRLTVLAVDAAQKRLTLSLKEEQPDPWTGAERRYPAGEKVEARVTRVVDFGAFAEVEPGLEGLCHVSELAAGRVNRVEDVVQVGENREFRVLEVDEDQKRLRLSIRAVDQGPEAIAELTASANRESPEQKAKRTARKKSLRGGFEDGSVGLGDIKL